MAHDKDLVITIAGSGGSGKTAVASFLTMFMENFGLTVINQDVADATEVAKVNPLKALRAMGDDKRQVTIGIMHLLQREPRTGNSCAEIPIAPPSAEMRAYLDDRAAATMEELRKFSDNEPSRKSMKRPAKLLVQEGEVHLFFGRLSDGNIHAVVRYPGGNYEAITTECEVKLANDKMLVKAKWYAWCRVNGIAEDTPGQIAHTTGHVMTCLTPVA